jgi:hypothetical protein
MTDEQHTAKILFDLDEAIRKAQNELDKLKEDRALLEQSLAEQIGIGGVTFIHDGATMVIVGPGVRAINKRAVDALKASLPSGLRPREVTSIKYPTVADVDRLDNNLSALGIDPAQIVTLKNDERPYSIRFRDGSDVDFGE